MAYIDSTPPQVARVVGGWILGIGVALFLVTYGEFGVRNPPWGALAALALLVVGALVLSLGTLRLRAADRANRRFFAAHAGTEILAARRRRQSRLNHARGAFFLTTVACAVWWVILAGTYACDAGVCTGFMPGHGAWIEWMQRVTVALGLATLAIAALARVHALETDRWEDLASDYLRRVDDGPAPGMKRSRWE